MKLASSDFLKAVSIVEGLPVDIGVSLLSRMLSDCDGICFEKDIGYEELSEAFRWLDRLKNHGRKIPIGEDAFDAVRRLEGDRKQEMTEWLVKILRKR